MSASPATPDAPAAAPRAGALRGALHLALLLAPVAALAYAGVARRWMSDDGFINLRVVRNVLEGHGPVFNVGERVEAVTSPLWIAVLTLAGALRLPPGPSAAWIGVALGALGALASLRASLDLAGARRLRDLAERAFVPFGALVFVALPVAWDFLSSGLENGLSYAWIGASFAALARRARASDDAPDAATPLRPLVTAAAVAGLGPLVRPDLAVPAGLFALVLVAVARRGRARPGALKAAAAIAAAAGALPVAYQLFRMGFYATTSPNTALAKEAFVANWSQGGLYLANYGATYQLLLPAGLLAVVIASELGALAALGRRMTTLAAAAPAVSAILCGLYVVRVGGDFMHGRMLLPATFLLLAPVWALPLRAAGGAPLRIPHAVAACLVAVWAAACAAALRMTVENQHNIGDERGWYVRGSQIDHPVSLEGYRRFYFYTEGEALLSVARALCPSNELPAPGAPIARCQRALYVDQPEYGRVQPDVAQRALDPASVEPSIVMVGARVAVGMMGYMLGPRVHLVDRVGLADPIASRLELASRGRPGHEKTLGNVWLVARYAAPSPDEEPAVAAARRALRCGDLAELDRAVREPLTLRRFLANVRRARALTRMRIPGDPFEAEQRFCTGGRRVVTARGGQSGNPFRLDCPERSAVAALRVTQGPAAPRTVAAVAVECRRVEAPGRLGEETGGQRAGGAGDGQEARLACGEGESIVGLHGAAGALVDRVGVLCARPGASPRRGDASGGGGGLAWELACPEGSVLAGVAGRAGDLVDAVGPVCAPPEEYRGR